MPFRFYSHSSAGRVLLAGVLACVGCNESTPAHRSAPDAPSAPEDLRSAASGDVAVATHSIVHSPTQVAGAPDAKLLPKLKTLGDSLVADFESIPAERKQQLDKLGLFLRTRLSSGQAASVVFICTHNSRRSHMGQISGALAAAYFGLDGVETFSGGTEATAFNPRAVAALERLGFEIENPGGDNPHYQVRFASNRKPSVAFSKKYDDPFNPKDGFAAVMTCDHADKNCPTVAGAALRIPLHFVDPKISDGTEEEAATYDERARQIATEVFYAMSRVKA